MFKNRSLHFYFSFSAGHFLKIATNTSEPCVAGLSKPKCSVKYKFNNLHR